MHLDQLQVELRPRSPWEAVELGTALVRRHARAIWTPWWLATLPVFVLANALGWWLDLVPWAAVLLWWLKPVFDRIPLFVVSRAVFGPAPAARDTLRAQLRWGLRPMLHALTWRRLGMARALYLPVDLLEGGARPGQRRRVIGGQVRGVAVLLTLACAHFELALVLAAYALLMLFVPVEFLGESARAAWSLLVEQPPRWAQVLANGGLWLATSLIEPFYVGAGFGLYLNRRTQIEAWDVEIAFRRMGQRLLAGGAPLALALVLVAGWLAPPSLAHAAPPPQGAAPTAEAVADEDPRPIASRSLDAIFGGQPAPAPAFEQAVRKAYTDPLLRPVQTEQVWRKRKPDKPDPSSTHALWPGLGRLLGFLGEAGLWILAGVGVVVLVATHRRWRPWLADAMPRAAPPSEIVHEPAAEVAQLPADVAGAARALWREGRCRRALALVYRASVADMAIRAGVHLLPGATEAECLRASRSLPLDEDRAAFAEVVRVWQYAAYAQRLPAEDAFDALLGRLAARFGWAA